MSILSPHKAQKSLLYLSSDPERKRFCTENSIPFPHYGWIDQQIISRALFGYHGAETVQRCTAVFGVFLWAPEFANVHDTFSFTEAPIRIDGEDYACSEAYYQAMKSRGCADHLEAKAIIKDCEPWAAYFYGQRYALRSDWEEAKIGVMQKAIHAKFSQSRVLKELLLATSPYPLVQIKKDGFWGSGLDASGKNMLGVLLQELRSEL